MMESLKSSNTGFQDRGQEALPSSININSLIPYINYAPQNYAEILNSDSIKNRVDQSLILAFLDIFNFGLVLLDSQGKIIFTNKTTRKIINNSGSFIITRTKTLKVVTAESDRELQKKIIYSRLLIAQTERINNHLSIINHHNGEKILIEILPLPNQAANNSPPMTGSIIFIRDANFFHLYSANALTALFNLSKSENKITKSLINGSTVQSIAKQRGTTLETVRGQLKNIFSKTGTRSQQELIRLSLQSELPLF